jgi:Restriction endonuclease S subunits
MTSNDWKEVQLKDVILFNPRESIKKGTMAKKISMDKLAPYQRKITGFEYAEFKSGTKFKNGDTLLARITPCLENGKTAQVDILDDNEIGFGSTEFIVMREISGISDNDFIYYLAISDDFRKIAIKSMTGTSGRQRVQMDVLEQTKLLIPPLREQKAIANILSTLDEKIETNNQINEKLEEMAQALFKHWFVDFEFPNENGEPYKSSGGEMVESELGMIPKGWEICQLDDLVDIIDNRGKTPPLSQNKTNYPIIDVKALTGTDRIVNYDNCSKFVDKNTYETWFRSGHPKTGDILLSTVGSIGELKLFFGDKGCIAQNVVALRTKNISYLYLFQYMRHIKKQLISYNIGSVQPSIKITHVKKHKILVPKKDIEDSFTEIIKNISFLIFNNSIENQRLVSIRDNLLPKLMSGEIRIPMEDGVLSEKN